MTQCAISVGDVVQVAPACAQAGGCVMVVAHLVNDAVYGYIAVPNSHDSAVYVVMVSVKNLSPIGRSKYTNPNAMRLAKEIAQERKRTNEAAN